jgi:hypothetical protein
MSSTIIVPKGYVSTSGCLFEWKYDIYATYSFAYTGAAVLSTAFVLLWQTSIVGGARKRAGIKYPQGEYFHLIIYCRTLHLSCSLR